MARGPRYRVKFRRRRLCLTDYRLREGLLKSGLPLFTPRFSNYHVYVGIFKPRIEGDVVLAFASTHELRKRFAWKSPRPNLPSVYLTAKLCAYKALTNGIRRAVLNIGLYRSTKGNRVYAAVKGARDAGLDVLASEEVFPSEDRIRGEHIARYASMILETRGEEVYQRMFSEYLRNGLRPENLPTHFDEVNKRIDEAFKDILESRSKNVE